MHDDNTTPGDRDDAHRANAGNLRRASRGESDASSEPAELPASDTPAPLSALTRPADGQEDGLSEDEIALYRRRVADGLYNSREVAAEVARRMLRRGDI